MYDIKQNEALSSFKPPYLLVQIAYIWARVKKGSKMFSFIKQKENISKTVRDLCEISIENDALCIPCEGEKKIFLKSGQVMKNMSVNLEIVGSF